MKPLARALAFAAVAFVVVFALALALGSEPVDLARAISEPSSFDRTAVFELRLPHVALAAIAGAGLALVGAAFQALLKNPLAEPFVLGVSGGAAFGATTMIALGVATLSTNIGGLHLAIGDAVVPIAAFAGGLGATLLVYAVARRGSAGTSGASILLAGVVVNSIAASLITFLKTFVPPSRAQDMLRWLTGFVDLPTTSSLGFVALYVAIGAVVLLRDAARLNLLALGDESAASLGVDVAALERRVFLASSAIVGAIVSVTGLIGFVGLVVPHALRRTLGPDHRRLLPLSLIAGAGSLVACDLVSRLSLRWFDRLPPVGAITALIGGPLFLALLRRRASA